MSEQVTEHDVLIIGGGMVGATLACALAKKTALNIGVVEAKLLPQRDEQGDLSHSFNPSYDERSTALSLGSCRFFDAIGVWDALRQHVEYIHQIHVSEQGKFGVVCLDRKEERVDYLGAVVENAWLGVVLGAKMSECSSITLHTPAQIISLQQEQSGYRVRIQRGDQALLLRCRLLVVADGANSTCCKLLGITQIHKDYEQVALVANLSPANGHQQTAYERFTAKGPMALLPLRENRFALVLTLPADQVDTYLSMDDQRFMKTIDQAMGGRLGGFIKAGERLSYPLRLIQAREQVLPCCVILGNAAHSLHPIAGQGFNLSVRDVAILTEELVIALAEQCAINEFSILQRYFARREQDQFLTVNFSDKLQKLFAVENTGLGLARATGLAVFDCWPAGKHLLARQAMGLKAGVSTL